MGEWIKCSERLPIELDEMVRFESMAVLATDGSVVELCRFNSGHGCGKPWASWSTYNHISADKITHWQPLPEPPHD